MTNQNVPIHWPITTLGEACLVNPRSFVNPVDGDQLISFVPMAAVEAGTGRLNPSRRRPYREVRKGYTPFSEGDVLFAKITPSMENGKVAIARGLNNGAGCGSTEFHVLRPTSGLSRDLLMHFLLQDEFRKEARAHMSGTAGQLRVPAGFLSSSAFPLPPLPEQHRIVAEIEKQLTRLDASVAALERVRANLKRYRGSVLKTACEGRLVPTEAELARAENRDYEPADRLLQRILAERRARWHSQPKRRRKYKDPARPDTSTLPDLPEGWVWATWSQLARRVTVGHVGPMKHEYIEAGVPFLRSQNVRANRFEPDGLKYISPTFHERLSKSTLQPGDLLVVRSGSVGVTCVVPESLTEANCADLVIVKKPEGIDSHYSSYYMNSSGAKSIVRSGQVGVALTHFNTKSVAALPVPLPPLAEQHRIVAEIERRLSVVQQAETVVGASLKRAGRLRQSILKQAFSGKLVPQDPNDEPASALLERIRAERAAASTPSPSTGEGRGEGVPQRHAPLKPPAKAQRKPRRRRSKPAPARQLGFSQEPP